MAITKKTFASDEDWLKFRANSIGGSDIGTLLGFNKWCTPMQWLLTHGSKPESFAMHLGHLLEPAVAQLFEEATECEFDEGCEENVIYVNSKFPGFHATPDRIGTLDGERFVLEIKTTAMHVRKDSIPEPWYCQIQQYLTILNIKRGYIAWLSGGNEFDFVEVERNDEMCEKMFRQALAVISGEKAPILEITDILAKFTKSTEREIELTAEDYCALDMMRQNCNRIKLLEAENESIKARLMRVMGDASVATFGGEKMITWKETKPRETFDTKAFRAEHPEFNGQYVKVGKPTRVFRVIDKD